MAHAGWKFIIVNDKNVVVRVGISDFEQAKKVALQKSEGGRIKRHSQLSHLEVEQLKLANSCHMDLFPAVKERMVILPQIGLRQ